MDVLAKKFEEPIGNLFYPGKILMAREPLYCPRSLVYPRPRSTRLMMAINRCAHDHDVSSVRGIH